MYFSFIRSQNEVLISSLSILKDMSVISESANKRVVEIERAVKNVLDTAHTAQVSIEEKLATLTDVERRFLEKREAIQKLREENDKLLVELKNAVDEAKENLGRISEQRQKAERQVHEIDVQQKIMMKSMIK
jgi:ABC-type transporter Mla subunit MlaD